MKRAVESENAPASSKKPRIDAEKLAVLFVGLFHTYPGVMDGTTRYVYTPTPDADPRVLPAVIDYIEKTGPEYFTKDHRGRFLDLFEFLEGGWWGERPPLACPKLLWGIKPDQLGIWSKCESTLGNSYVERRAGPYAKVVFFTAEQSDHRNPDERMVALDDWTAFAKENAQE